MERPTAVEAARALLAVRPKTTEHLRHATYTLGLVAREVGIPLNEAIEAALKWREELEKHGMWVPRTDFVRHQIKQAYRRTKDLRVVISQGWGLPPPGQIRFIGTFAILYTLYLGFPLLTVHLTDLLTILPPFPDQVNVT